VVGDWSSDVCSSDLEREEARLATALLAGDIPLAWYRHRMTELAARDESPGDSAST